MEKPPILGMIMRAITDLDGRASYIDIALYIRTKWGGVRKDAIRRQLVACTVNHPSRIRYKHNKEPRVTDGPRDILFRLDEQSGLVERYNPATHGVWEIRMDQRNKPYVAQRLSPKEALTPKPDVGISVRDLFRRDVTAILAAHNLILYIVRIGSTGLDYRTEAGIIDALAVDPEGNFVVLDLNLEVSADRAVWRILQCMDWVETYLAGDKTVRGIILTPQPSIELRRAVGLIPLVTVAEIKLNITIKPITS